MRTIYIGCPARVVTGGPTLAHQMCRELIDMGIPAKMYYYGKEKLFDTWDGIDMSPYAKYELEPAESIQEIDQDGNIVILSETAVPMNKAFSRASVHMWWMSVNNYLYTLIGNEDRLGEDLAFLQKDSVLHFVQSAYAESFLTGDMQIPTDRITYLTDYIDELYLDPGDLSGTGRENIVYYNYKKRGNELPAIMEKHPEINWVPIRDMTQNEIVDAFHRGKVYVDFGTHPGKDRIPREAASCGLCILTNKAGSAAYEADVPIGEGYKYSDPAASEEDIVRMINYCFDDYENRVNEFAGYREWIRGERERFHQEVVSVSQLLG